LKLSFYNWHTTTRPRTILNRLVLEKKLIILKLSLTSIVKNKKKKLSKPMTLTEMDLVVLILSRLMWHSYFPESLTARFRMLRLFWLIAYFLDGLSFTSFLYHSTSYDWLSPLVREHLIFPSLFTLNRGVSANISAFRGSFFL